MIRSHCFKNDPSKQINESSRILKHYRPINNDVDCCIIHLQRPGIITVWVRVVVTQSKQPGMEAPCEITGIFGSLLFIAWNPVPIGVRSLGFIMSLFDFLSHFSALWLGFVVFRCETQVCDGELPENIIVKVLRLSPFKTEFEQWTQPCFVISSLNFTTNWRHRVRALSAALNLSLLLYDRSLGTIRQLFLK